MTPWRRKWQPTPGFLPGESQRQTCLMGYSPWDCKESNTTEQLALFILYKGLISKINNELLQLNIKNNKQPN